MYIHTYRLVEESTVLPNWTIHELAFKCTFYTVTNNSEKRIQFVFLLKYCFRNDVIFFGKIRQFSAFLKTCDAQELCIDQIIKKS